MNSHENNLSVSIDHHRLIPRRGHRLRLPGRLAKSVLLVFCRMPQYQRRGDVMARKCIDCGTPVKNRSKSTRRCFACNLLWRRKNKTGLKLPKCSLCGKKLSTKINSSGLCRKCWSLSNPSPPNKNKKGGIPWNKGKSIYASAEEKRDAFLKRKNQRWRNSSIPQRLFTLVRTRIRLAFRTKKQKLTLSTKELLGCDTKFLKTYLESLFLPGMNWNNYGLGEGKWNIDHIVPISYYDLDNLEDQKQAFHYSNCRPIWALDNIKKNANTILN